MKGTVKMKDINIKPKRKKYSIHDLYPEDYCFDWEAFNADPEHYVFTKEDIAYYNAMELEKYENTTPMTPGEKRVLRKWVKSGHSVMETPPSRYACVHCFYPPPDFLDVYRTDKELDAETKGMSEAEVLEYLQEYTGRFAETEEERDRRLSKERLRENTPEEVHEKIRLLQRKLGHIWHFILEADLREQAMDYVEKHMDEPIPFEDEW